MCAVTSVGLSGIHRRLGASLVVVFGVAGAVAVFVCIFAMAQGYTEAANKTARTDRAIILSADAKSEAQSALSRKSVDAILNQEWIKRTPGGQRVASAEILTSIRLTDKRTRLDAFATLRGVGSQIAELRPEIRLKEGRWFRPGTREVIVGRSAQVRLEGLAIGSQLLLPGGKWAIVGTFESGGDSHQSELLCDAEVLLSAYNYSLFNSMTVLLKDPSGLSQLKDSLKRDPTLSVDVVSEPEYFAEASKEIGSILTFIAYAIGSIMGLGAVIVALNTMYSAVSARMMEIATFRAIGFGGGAIVTSVFIEALFLALLGGVVGASVAWLFFQSSVVSTLNGTNDASMTYSLTITPGIALLAIACASCVGMLGGLLPAIRATRISVATAMRNY